MKIFNYYFTALTVLSYIFPLIATQYSNTNGPAGPLRAAIRACPYITCPDLSCAGSTGATGSSAPCASGAIASLTCLAVNQNETIRGSLSTACETINNNLIVGGSTDLKGILQVGQATQIVGMVCAEQRVGVGENASISGNELLLGILTVDDGAVIDIGLTQNGNQTNNANLIISGNETIGTTLVAQGTANLNGPTIAAAGLTVTNGETISSGGLTILAGGATLTGNVCIIGNEIVTDVIVNDELTVDENAVLANVTTSPATTLITNSSVIFNDGLTIAAGNEVINNGNLNLTSGNLTVGGASTFAGRITANGGQIVNGGLTVNGGQNIPMGNLTITTGNAIIAGSLSVNGSITGSGGASLKSLTITDPLNASSATGPAALVVAGGVGVGKDVWKGGSEFFTNVATAGGTPAPLNYYEEACFTTPFVWGGATVEPATAVTIKMVRVGDVVNLIVPVITINNPGVHVDVINSVNPLPFRFRPTTTIRGASSTVVSTIFGAGATGILGITGRLGEYNVDPSGTITFGLAGPNMSPQRISSLDFVEEDSNTITYNVNAGNCSCRLPRP